MAALKHIVRYRVVAIVLGIAVTAGALVYFALHASQAGRTQLAILARTEIQADDLAREFRRDVDELHSVLLRLTSLPPDEARAKIERLRGTLRTWVEERLARSEGLEDSGILHTLARELATYFRDIDAVLPLPGHTPFPLTREEAQIIAFDDASVRVGSLANEYSNIHMDQLKETLQGSLQAVMRLRLIVFACVVLLVGGLAGLGYFLYRDFVQPLRLMVVDRDQALARGEKLAALGTLAAGVAHEIRNPLTAMKARLFALRKAPLDPVVREDLTAIQQDIARLERIVRDVLDYAHPGEAKFGDVDLVAWAREVAAFLQPEMQSASVTLEIEGTGPLIVQADAERLRQVALNLIRNSREAFESKPGRIVLSLQRAEMELRGHAGAVAILAVTDDGPGIPAEIRDRLFDPFFTTKAAGTGLGLSIVAQIVEAHGGEIALQTVPEGGTRFEVRLPLASIAPTA